MTRSGSCQHRCSLGCDWLTLHWCSGLANRLLVWLCRGFPSLPDVYAVAAVALVVCVHNEGMWTSMIDDSAH